MDGGGEEGYLVEDVLGGGRVMLINDDLGALNGFHGLLLSAGTLL